jgi:ABC-type arginine transport system permease subunit
VIPEYLAVLLTFYASTQTWTSISNLIAQKIHSKEEN